MTPEERTTAENYARKIHSHVAKRDPNECFAIPIKHLTVLCRGVFEEVIAPPEITPARQSVLDALTDGPKAIDALQKLLGYKSPVITENMLKKMAKDGLVTITDQHVSLPTG